MSKNKQAEETAKRQPGMAKDRIEDLHLRLSERYQAYKDLAGRCLLNTALIDKGDKRVFYLKPTNNIFLEEPRKQNQYRNNFVRQVSAPPQPEPFTLIADDLYKNFVEQIADQSCPSVTKEEMCNFFKRRQYNLQQKKYKLLLRWAHHALTSELVDKVSLKFSPTYSKLQFELENAVKRHQRLEGEDHFLNGERPVTKAMDPTKSSEEEQLEQVSTLRIDDIDVYLRITTYQQKTVHEATKFIQRVKWTPMLNRFEIFKEAYQYKCELRQESVRSQKDYLGKIEAKGNFLVKYRKLGSEASKEVQKIIQNQHLSKYEKRIGHNFKERIMSSAKQGYEIPAFMVWNEIELKLQLAENAPYFGIHGDMDVDQGHSFAYNIFVFFPTYFTTQVIKSQFAIYDAIPDIIDPQSLMKDKVSQMLTKFGNSKGLSGTLRSSFGLHKGGQLHFINSVERALFGEFNSGQIKEFPQVRVKHSHWLPYICFKPIISSEQMAQAAALGSIESNPQDECCRVIIDLITVQDAQNVSAVLEGISTVHHDKVRYGQIRSDFLLKHAFQSQEDIERIKMNDEEQIYSEGEKSFLSLFSDCLKPQSLEQPGQQRTEVSGQTLLELPLHLLYSLYMLKYLNARDSAIKLLYTLNVFRSVQKRMALDMREMGTRERVMGDSVFLGPMEIQQVYLGQVGEGSGVQASSHGDKHSAHEDTTHRSISGKPDQSVFHDTNYSQLYKVDIGPGSPLKQKTQVQVAKQSDDPVDVINDNMIDIFKIRFNGRLQNLVYSSNPILPRFHSAFGEPVARQELSSEMEGQKNSDNKKEEGKKLLGRVDTITFDQHSGYYFVKDDWGKFVMYDSAQADLNQLSEEVLKIVSFYINKQEPVLAETDLRNTFPAVDRFQLIQEAFDCELRYQNAKTELVLSYLECYEHIADMLEQQRMVQIITDLMAARPRLNLRGTHFKDSYKAEIECLTLQNEIVREVMRMQMKSEFDANNSIREYLERTYRLVMDQADSKFVYQKPEGLDAELKTRENLQKGLTEDSNQALKKQATAKGGAEAKDQAPAKDEGEQPKFTNAKFSDPKEFAAYLGIPFASLQMLMKDHKERDPMVQQTIHEHVSFIKIEEGYPVFMYDMSSKLNNTVMYTSNSNRIGMLDFYDSLTIMVKIVAAIKGAVGEIHQTHRPESGLTSSALELATLKFIQAELKIVKGEKQLMIAPKKEGMPYLEDDSIVGNSDRMLFYVKEFAVSAEDEQASHNPYILTKLNLKTISNYSFDAFQKLLIENQAKIAQDGLQEDLQKRRKINQHHAYRFFPKLKARAQKIFIPSMLFLTCNSLEVLRLRNLLTSAILQTELLEQLYAKQSKFLNKEAIIYFKDPFNFQTFIDFADKNYVNFVDEGPASGIDIGLAINEFDPTLRSHINFTDPDSFKMMISPIGLEELRFVLMYQLMHLHTLMVVTKINQQLLDVPMREIAEIDLLLESDTVLPNPTLDYFSKLHGSFVNEVMLKRQMQQERTALMSRAQSSLHELYQSVISKKNRSKIMIQNIFQKARADIVDPQEKHEVQLRKLRTYRLLLGQDYCMDILSEVYTDAMRLQLIETCNNLRHRSFLLPKEQIFLQVQGPHGEYRSFYNQLQQAPARFLDEHGRATKMAQGAQWSIPSNHEILKELDLSMHERLMEHDFPKAYLFKNEKGQKMVPNITKDSQAKLILKRLPKIERIDFKEVDVAIKRKKRFVEYNNSLSLEVLPIIQVLRYFTNVQNLMDLEFFQTKLQSQSQTMADLEASVMSGLPFWDIPEDSLLGLQPNDEDPSTLASGDRIGIENLGYKNLLAQRVIDRLASEKRAKLTLNQELESGVLDKFKDLAKTMMRLELHESVEKAASFIGDHVAISFYSLLSSLGYVADKLHSNSDLLGVIQRMSRLQEVKVSYTNGFHVNHAITDTHSISIEPTSQEAHEDFLMSAQPVIDERALIPTELTLIEGLYGNQAHTLVSSKKGSRGYAGRLNGRDYQYLDFALVNLDRGVRKQIQQQISSFQHQIQEFIKVKCGATQEVLNVSNHEYVTEILHESSSFLRAMVRARHLKRVILILLNKRTIPADDQKRLQQMLRRFQEEVQWKINVAWDEQQFDKIKQMQKTKHEIHEKIAKAQEQGLSTTSLVQVLKKQNEKAMSNALQQYEQAHCEIEVLQGELHRFLLQTSFNLLAQESAALARCFEMNGKQFEFYLHPCQQFASTPHQSVDKRNHLDPINKVSFAQKFLTQIRNRCLEIETLTSGVGVVISKKDLNECLEEASRSIIKTFEVEMRTRCETNALQMVHYDNLLYIKDQQLRNLELKLCHAKGELDKIIRTKVFSRGKQLVYELDFNSRQLRMLKDNLHSMEHRLTQEINITYERELNQTRMELEQSRRKFQDFQLSLNTVVTADVRDNINSIDQIMKGKAEFFKDVRRQLPQTSLMPTLSHNAEQATPATTINIGSVVIQNFSRQQSTGVQGNPGSNQKEQVQIQALQLVIGELEYQVSTLQKQLKEFTRLKDSERKAHASILQLQDLIRKQRVLARFKEVLLRQKYEHELDNLRAQLNNNTELWQQLAESQKREAIIKADLDGVQQHIITQEKIIEQLKDELRLEKIEKTKLMQYKVTKSKRLEDLEGKAREFEVMSNLNLPKMVSMLESRDTQIDQLKTNMKLNEAHISSTLKQREIEIQSFRKKLEVESRIKGEALVKLENLRHELQLIEGGTDVGIADVWKDKCRKLIDICKSFKEENDRLQLQQSIGNPSLSSSNANQDLLSEASLIEQSFSLHHPSHQQRFKKKIELVSQHQKHLKDAAMLQNQSFAAAPHQNSVLAGNFHSTGNFSQSLERVQSNQIKLPKLEHKPQSKGSLQKNIFQGETAPIADTGESVKTPLRTIYDQESHISSIQPNLDPMYDPKNSLMGMQKVLTRNLEQRPTDANVFASLKEESKNREHNLSIQTSGTVLADYNNNYSGDPSQYLQQQLPMNPPGIISQPRVFDNPSFAQTQFSRNQVNVFMSAEGGAQLAMTVGNQGAQNMFNTHKSEAKHRSAERATYKSRVIKGTHGLLQGSGAHAKHIDIASMVRAKLMSPPRALQREVEHSGFRGHQVMRKRDLE